MIQEGQIVLFRFPQTDQSPGKLRPALVLRNLPGVFNDWLICKNSLTLNGEGKMILTKTVKPSISQSLFCAQMRLF